MEDPPALGEIAASGLPYRIVRYGGAKSAEDAAARRGIDLAALVKTLVVRRSEDDYVLVLVPGDRTLDWPKLRAALGVTRLSMADRQQAREATGYAPGTITPFGTTRPWPVVADRRVARLPEASIGGGSHGVALHLGGPDLVGYLAAQVADVTRAG